VPELVCQAQIAGLWKRLCPSVEGKLVFRPGSQRLMFFLA